jgi:tetratricopeptide (TPR) repeat protein
MADVELVPHPDLDELKPEVRDALRPAVEYFRGQRAKLQGSNLGVAYGRMGINYLAHQQQEAAGACFRNANSLDPQNPRWPYLLAVHYEETGFLDNSVESYRAALQLDPAYLPGYIRLGRVFMELNRFDEAEAAFMVVVRADENNAAALTGLGRVAFQRQQYKEAINYFEKAMSIEPEADVLHYRLGMAYRALGEAERAREELAQAGERRPVIVDPLLGIVHSHIRGAQHYLRRAAAAESEGDLQAAIGFYKVAVSVAPFDINALLRLGQLQAFSAEPEQALESFSRVLGLEPGNAIANYFFGTLLEQRGEDAEARIYYERALETEPGLLEPRFQLANSLMRAGEYQDAAGNYAQIAQSQQENAELIYRLGMAWLAAGQCEDAVPVLLAAYRLAQRSPRVTTAATRALSTCSNVTDDQKKQALAAAQAMYAENPAMETAETLAMAAAANGKYQDAVDFQAQAIFEGLKQHQQSRLEWMQNAMAHYRNGEPAPRPWESGADVYQPPRVPPLAQFKLMEGDDSLRKSSEKD